jgi:hypothetical protein
VSVVSNNFREPAREFCREQDFNNVDLIEKAMVRAAEIVVTQTTALVKQAGHNAITIASSPADAILTVQGGKSLVIVPVNHLRLEGSHRHTKASFCEWLMTQTRKPTKEIEIGKPQIVNQPDKHAHEHKQNSHSGAGHPALQPA